MAHRTAHAHHEPVQAAIAAAGSHVANAIAPYGTLASTVRAVMMCAVMRGVLARSEHEDHAESGRWAPGILLYSTRNYV